MELKEMVFEEWLRRWGYFPIFRIKENYISQGQSKEYIDERVNEIKNEYIAWCDEKGFEPTFEQDY